MLLRDLVLILFRLFDGRLAFYFLHGNFQIDKQVVPLVNRVVGLLRGGRALQPVVIPKLHRLLALFNHTNRFGSSFVGLQQF